MRRLLPAMCVSLIVAGCGQPEPEVVPGGPYNLYEATSGTPEVSVIDSASHAVKRRLPLGTTTADWKHMYWVSRGTVSSGPGQFKTIGSELLEIDPETGSTVHNLQLNGDFHLPTAALGSVPGGLSQNGRWLVVESFEENPNAPPLATHLLVIETSFAAPPARIDLRGFFEFDAISNDGRRVFLIEHISGSAYRVRVYDLARALLDPRIVVDKADRTEAITGLKLSGVASPDGKWLYNVYAREHNGPFVHALDLDAWSAFRIDLPGGGYASGDGDSALDWSLALSRDGSHLYAANGMLGVVTDISTRSDSAPALRRTGRLGSSATAWSLFVQDVEAKELGTGNSVLTPDGRTLVMTRAAGVVWVDTETLAQRRYELDGWRIWGLALSPDGKVLFAVNDRGMVAELSMSAGGSVKKFKGAPGQPLALIRVEPT